MSNEKNIASERGVGVGYVSLVMIFAVICLTVLATLSYQAARANDKLNEKSIAFTDGYYAADSSAKELLAALDENALLAYESGFFDDSFTALCGDYENITLNKVSAGYEVSFAEYISDKISLSVKITFFSNPVNERYIINEWKIINVSDAEENNTLGVWDGENLT